MSTEVFHSKILLFGEYTIIENSDALAVPYARYGGYLGFMDEGEKDQSKVESNQILQRFCDFLKLNPATKNKDGIINMAADLEKGLYFQSNIPNGYGIGSSGALTAAIYSRYFGGDRNGNLHFTELKSVLASMEAYFHGTSSGIDPLISYCNQPIYFSLSKIEPIQSKFNTIATIFLLDTKKERKATNFINHYLDKFNEVEFRCIIYNELIPVTHNCIKGFVQGNSKLFFSSLKQLSAIQLEHFQPMILPEYQPVWQNGLLSGTYNLKLCGAGGGGFILGFTTNLEEARMEISNLCGAKLETF